MAQIGTPQREIHVEPIVIPVPTRMPQEAPAPSIPAPQPVLVPV